MVKRLRRTKNHDGDVDVGDVDDAAAAVGDAQQLTQLLGLKMHTLPNLGDAVIASSERLIRLHC